MKFFTYALPLFLSSVISQGCKPNECTKGDVSCFARCYNVPDPTQEQVEEATDCNAQCTLDNGSDECYSNCVQTIFLRYNTPSANQVAQSKTSDSSNSQATSASSNASPSSAPGSDSASNKSEPTSIKNASTGSARNSRISSSRGLPSNDEQDSSALSQSVSRLGLFGLAAVLSYVH